MKNLKLILILAISILAISCGDDDEPTPAGPSLTPELLEGTYDLNFFEATIVIDEEVTGGTARTTVDIVADTFGDSNIIFNSNETFTLDFQYRTTTTTMFQDDEPTVETEIVSFTDSGSYTVDDATQTITIDGDMGDVVVFSNGQLRLEFEDVEVDGDTTITSNQELRFTRQ